MLGQQGELCLGAVRKGGEVDAEQPADLAASQRQAHLITAPELHRHRR
jgi:hypothetical protein